MESVKQDLIIQRSASFQFVMQWFSSPPIHQAISAVQPGWPTVITVTAHGITTRVPVWITNVKNPRALNTEGPYGCRSLFATPMDANTLAVDVNTGNDQGSYAGNGILTNMPVMNLTGYTADLQVRASPANYDILLELTTSNGGITLDPTTGQITLTATAAQTALLDFSNGVYDLLLTSPTGFVTRLAYGDVTIERSVTHAQPPAPSWPNDGSCPSPSPAPSPT